MSETRTRLTREESQAQTRERLLAAARSEVARQGFGRASVRDIAEAAGYSQGAFYSNFASKEAILLQLMRQHMLEEADQLKSILASADDAADSALEDLQAWADTLNAEIDWSMLALELQLHAHRSSAFAADYDEVMSGHSKALGVIVDGFYQKLGRKPQLDPRQLAGGYMALAHGLALQRRRDSDAPAGKLIMIFVKALLTTAEPVLQN